MKPKLVWTTYNPDRGSHYYGDQVLLHSIIKDHVEERFDFTNLENEGAIVSIRSGDNLKYMDEFNSDIQKLKWCIVIITGNEESDGMQDMIDHPNCKVWVQTPKVTDSADFFLGCGCPAEMAKVEGYDPKKSDNHEIYDWCFSGQVTQRRREECVEVLRGLKNGYLLETGGFAQGLKYPEYVKVMSQSKIIACPGGAMTPDSFRVYEALELGCVPVVDMHSGYKKYGGNYWHKVYGDVPFPILENWSEFPEILNYVLANWGEYKERVNRWWSEHKEKIKTTLLNQSEELL